MNNAPATNLVHVFEQAGLGKAPFRFVGFRYIAKCRACGIHTTGLTAGQDANRDKHDPARCGAVYTHASGSHVLDCRGCGQPRYAKMIRGKFSEKHVCAAKCMASTGTVCECSCAGRNHGASWAAP